MPGACGSVWVLDGVEADLVAVGVVQLGQNPAAAGEVHTGRRHDRFVIAEASAPASLRSLGCPPRSSPYSRAAGGDARPLG
jgi:hypothetical protein